MVDPLEHPRPVHFRDTHDVRYQVHRHLIGDIGDEVTDAARGRFQDLGGPRGDELLECTDHPRGEFRGDDSAHLRLFGRIHRHQSPPGGQQRVRRHHRPTGGREGLPVTVGLLDLRVSDDGPERNRRYRRAPLYGQVPVYRTATAQFGEDVMGKPFA